MQIELSPADRDPRGRPATFNMVAIRAEQERLKLRSARSRPTLTRVFDFPRVVTLAGESFAARQLRVIDLAEIQAWLDDQVEHPLADWEPGLELAPAWRACGDWPPRFGAASARGLLATLGGRALFLLVVLKRCQEIAPDTALRLAATATASEWRSLYRVAWGISPRAEIVAEVVPDLAPSPGVDWPDRVYRIMDAHGLTFEQVGELTISQWVILNNGGKLPEAGPEFGARLRRAQRHFETDGGPGP